MRNNKQIVLWSHPRSGSTYLTNLLTVYFIELFEINLINDDESSYDEKFIPIWDNEVKEFRDEILTANILKNFYDYNDKDVYTVWKLMTTYYKNNKPKFKIDYDNVYNLTNSYSIGRKCWKNTVISFLKSKQTGLWNTTEKIKLEEFDYKNVKVKDFVAICHMISFWQRNMKKYDMTNIWYEDLSFTSEDLGIFGFNYSGVNLDFDKFTKKVTNEYEYELFDKIVQDKNISLPNLIKRTKLELDPENTNLLKDI